MTEVVLLAVVEVPHDERVRCQAAECNHPVYRRIHVVQADGRVSVLGSECFKRTVGLDTAVQLKPKYGTLDGRHLTEAERALLLENTARLIELFEAERQAALSKAERVSTRHPDSSPAPRPAERPAEPVRHSAAEVARAEVLAKEVVRKKYNVDPDLPGWRGFVLIEMREFLRANAA